MNVKAQRLLQESFDARKLDNGEIGTLIVVDEDVDITIRPGISTTPRAV